ncbi:MAG: aminotransferase class III-fold pyridoxal phosphate-dependent enzyme [Flammeovirgaceae bacterium]|nr:aminotransferase class III-fold pyridoxal phosphate-dependent enzyme [Flammeovirgaceae bacterium]
MNLFDVYPLFDINIVKAKGSFLWDENENQYLDLYGGHAVISIGHGHPSYVEAIKSQVDKIGFYSNSIVNTLQDALADKLGQLSGYSHFNLFLCNSGAEANENALKIASFTTERKKVIAFRNAFHGRTSGSVAATDNPKIVAPFNSNHEIIFLPFNDEDAFATSIDDSVAAVIIEGIQGVGGIQIPTDSFLQTLRKQCSQHGAMLILDEIQSGYGRTGKFFAHQYAGIEPDLITVAKGMGNGFPIGGVLIHPEIKSWHGMLGTTFGGNHLACAAGLAVLEVIENENLVENAFDVGDYLMNELKQFPQLLDVRGRGLMIGFDLPPNLASLRKDLLSKHRIFTGEAKPNTVRLLPALNVTLNEVDIFLKAMNAELKLKVS